MWGDLRMVRNEREDRSDSQWKKMNNVCRVDFSSSLYLNTKRKRFFESIQKGTEARCHQQRFQNMKELTERKSRKIREKVRLVRSTQRRRRKEKKPSSRIPSGKLPKRREAGRYAPGRPQLRDDGPTNPNCRDSPDHPARKTSMTKAWGYCRPTEENCLQSFLMSCANSARRVGRYPGKTVEVIGQYGRNV